MMRPSSVGSSDKPMSADRRCAQGSGPGCQGSPIRGTMSHRSRTARALTERSLNATRRSRHRTRARRFRAARRRRTTPHHDSGRARHQPRRPAAVGGPRGRHPALSTGHAARSRGASSSSARRTAIPPCGWPRPRAPPAARSLSLELRDFKIEHARQALTRAGLSTRVEFHAGDCLETLKTLPGPFDFVLLDVWKDLYLPCFELVHPKLAPGAHHRRRQHAAAGSGAAAGRGLSRARARRRATWTRCCSKSATASRSAASVSDALSGTQSLTRKDRATSTTKKP